MYSLPVIILIASPSAILIFAYWFAVWVQMPVAVRFDRRIPEDIKNACNEGVRTKKRKLICSIILSLFAAVLVSSALIAASLSKQTSPPHFKAYCFTKQERDIIAVSGLLPADTKIILRISSVPRLVSSEKSKECLYVTSQLGVLQTNIELVFTADKYEVTIEWQEDDGLVRSLERTVISERKQQTTSLNRTTHYTHPLIFLSFSS